MKLILVRHGETEENIKKIVQGHMPGHLSKNGLQQIKKVATRLKNEKFDIIFSSDLGRAKKTAQAIKKFHKKTLIKFVKEVREKNHGIFEGKPSEEYRAKYKNAPLDTCKPEKGESLEEVKDRASKFFTKIPKKYENILIVSHGGFIKMLLAYLLNKTVKEAIEEFSTDNTCVNILISKGEEFKPQLLNCTHHLKV